MRDHFEEIWRAMPAGASPPDHARRRAFLREQVAAGDGVLDLGCGAGAFTAAIVEAGATPVGADVAEAALVRARATHPGAEFVRVPYDGPLPFEEATFDVVWASEVIEHVADTARWLSEARRVLRPDGRIALTTPYHGRVRTLGLALHGFEAHFDPRADHLRFYTRRSLRELLEDFGFDDVRIDAAGGPPLLRRTLHAAGRRASWRAAP